MATEYTNYQCPICGLVFAQGMKHYHSNAPFPSEERVREIARTVWADWQATAHQQNDEFIRSIARDVFLESGENRVERVRSIADEQIAKALKPAPPRSAPDGAISARGVGEVGETLRPSRTGERCTYCGYPDNMHNEVCVTRRISALERERDQFKAVLFDCRQDLLREGTERDAAIKDRDTLRSQLAASEKALDAIEVAVNNDEQSLWSISEALKRAGRLGGSNPHVSKQEEQ